MGGKEGPTEGMAWKERKLVDRSSPLRGDGTGFVGVLRALIKKAQLTKDDLPDLEKEIERLGELGHHGDRARMLATVAVAARKVQASTEDDELFLPGQAELFHRFLEQARANILERREREEKDLSPIGT